MRIASECPPPPNVQSKYRPCGSVIKCSRTSRHITGAWYSLAKGGVRVGGLGSPASEEDEEDGELRGRCLLRGGRREEEEKAAEVGARKAVGLRALRGLARKGSVADARRGSSSIVVRRRRRGTQAGPEEGEEDRGEGRLVDGRMHQDGRAGRVPPVVVEGVMEAE